MSASALETHRPLRSTTAKATLGATLGSVVEWFDVAVYAYLAPVIGMNFFPTGNQATGLLLSFAVFGAAFVVRPLGGLVFGVLGDKIGRQKVLAAVLLLVSGATVGIGLLPTYAAIGVAAPIALVGLRLVQGFSAGGELSGAAVFVAEHSPPRRRGYFVSWMEMGAIAGFLLGALAVLALNLSLTDSQLHAWGWRLPFLMAAPMGAIGLYVRSRLEETPEFTEVKNSGEVEAHPLRETLVHHWPAVLRAAGFGLYQNAALYVILTFVPSYMEVTLERGPDVGALSAVVTMTVICVLIPVVGHLSDRIGRRPLLMGSCVTSLLTSVPLFWLMGRESVAAVFAAHLMLGVFLSLYLGVTMAAISELFSTKVRFGGFAIGYNLSVAAFGGTAPFIVTWMMGFMGNLAPAYYIMASAAVTLMVVATSPETAPRRIERNPRSR
ncbi:MFS transporter [Streptomyces sp. SHP 1-2]|uniref:MFS transporter n=1 Tax=Streptomyces sp. SHP 1-2 TaxID=2769489 RepID=UPI0022375249|nr:MFS transporter [Streptomyces sp. SHP 1-2]